jgi:hypothetical protein
VDHSEWSTVRKLIFETLKYTLWAGKMSLNIIIIKKTQVGTEKTISSNFTYFRSTFGFCVEIDQEKYLNKLYLVFQKSAISEKIFAYQLTCNYT